MKSEPKATKGSLHFPHPLSNAASRPRFIQRKLQRFHTSAENEGDWQTNTCNKKHKKPLEVKEYSNKFLRENGLIDQDYGRQIKSTMSRRLFRHQLDEKENFDGKGDHTVKGNDSSQRKAKKSEKISTSRALQLFSKILKTNKAEGGIVEYRKNIFKNINFNIQRINLRQKRSPKTKDQHRSFTKTEAKTEHIIQRRQRPHKPPSRHDNQQIEPWQIYIDNDF